MTEINSGELKAAVKELNALEVEGIEKIRTVGITLNAMAIAFIAACNAISEQDESLLSDSIVAVYNTLPDPKVLVEAAAADKKEKPAKEKPEKKAKEPKPPKEKKEKKEKAPKKLIEKSRYGHIQSAKSGKLDDMLFEGGTVAEIMAGCDVPRLRVIGHANHLKKDLGLTLLITENKEDSLKTKYKVKEESIGGKIA